MAESNDLGTNRRSMADEVVTVRNRSKRKLIDGMRNSFWSQGMHGGIKGLLGCIEAFSEAKLNAHPGGDHGICQTSKGQVNADLLDSCRG